MGIKTWQKCCCGCYYVRLRGCRPLWFASVTARVIASYPGSVKIFGVSLNTGREMMFVERIGRQQTDWRQPEDDNLSAAAGMKNDNILAVTFLMCFHCCSGIDVGLHIVQAMGEQHPEPPRQHLEGLCERGTEVLESTDPQIYWTPMK